MTRVTFPDFMTIDSWAASLKTNFPKGNIPTLKAFPTWQAWAKFVVGMPYFAGNRIPPPTESETWQSWARKLIQVLYV